MLEKIKEIVADQLGIDEDDIKLNHRLQAMCLQRH